MTRRRLLFLLAPTGTLAAHGLAYVPFVGGHGDEDGMHSYLPFVAVVALPGAIAALLWLATCRRGRAVQLPSPGALVFTQVGVFAVQEVVERLAANVSLSELVHHPAVRLGLVLQVLTAAASLLATRALRRTIGGFLGLAGRGGLVFAARSVHLAVCGATRSTAGAMWMPSSRGPPVVAS
jgi:hypothetical protein